MAAGREKISFLQWSDTGYFNDTPGQASRGQHKMDSMFVGFLGCFACICFLRKRNNMKFGGGRIREVISEGTM